MKNWETKSFEDCIEPVKYTKKIPSKDYKDEGLYPIISQEDELISGYWDSEDDIFKVNSPVVIFGDHTRVLKYVDFDFVLGADGVKILQPKEFLDAKYFLYFLKNTNIKSLGYARHYRLLKELEILLPPLEEQKRIVKNLDEKFAQLETVKANAKSNLQNAKDLLFAELTKTFEQESWETMSLQDVCTRKITDGTHQTPKYCTQEEGGYPFISSKDVTKEYIDWTKIKYIVPELHEELYKRIAPQKDDVLLAKNGTTGVAAIVEDDKVFDIYVTLAVLRPNKEIVNPRYLLAIVNSPLCKEQFNAHLKGSGVPNLHLEEIQKVIIPVPPLNEQESVVKKIENLKLKVHEIEEIYTKQLANCDELKQAFLAKSFAGKL